MEDPSSSKVYQELEIDVPQESPNSITPVTTAGMDITSSSSHFFEVLYVGKVKINPQDFSEYCKSTPGYVKVPETFIDDIVTKIRAQGFEKSISSASILSTKCQQLKKHTIIADASSNAKGTNVNSNYSEGDHSTETCTNTTVDSTGAQLVLNTNISNDERHEIESMLEKNDNDYVMRSRAMSAGNILTLRRDSKGSEGLNRTMLFQVGNQDLRLISPDRKQVLLHKLMKDVACSVQGIKYPEYLGFICKDSESNSVTGYIFKCQSESFADDLVGAISQAFVSTYNGSIKKEKSVVSCEHCPMTWYNKLCLDIEGQSDRNVQRIIFSRMEMLPENEQEVVVKKYKKVEAANDISTGTNLQNQNEILMMLLRAHCEAKQARHVHDTAENRSEFLNQYLSVGVGSTIFMKAKRSLTNSFDHLMKRKSSKDDFGLSPNQKASSQSPVGSRPDISIMDTSSLNSAFHDFSENQSNASTSPKSPMMDIFMKVGNSPRISLTESNIQETTSSWRQAILNRVVSSSKDQEYIKNSIKTGNIFDNSDNNMKRNDPSNISTTKKSKEELRALWKKAINQQLILIRMEKENAKLKVRQEEATVKRIKMEYDELSSCARELVEVWDLLISKESRVSTKCDNQMLLQAIKQGVPRGRRGEVWQFLAEQFCLKQPPIDTKDFPNYNTPYEILLKQLTSQQHAILIDLGRTFPNHPYFSSPLGPGQLALYNLLKAYSLLDHEVGYCQGLSFVAGVLLLHMAEDQAFSLLRHLMFRRGLRKLYLPDMAALQLHLYQLSRLLYDRLPAIYNHFDKYELSPTLYAAPWLLTLFASQFPLGFVTRVYDLLFLESTEIVFKVALALLEDHQEQILACDNFEETMHYLKVRVSAVDKSVLDRVMKRVFYPDMEIAKQLNEYKVEYHVLQEELKPIKLQMENVQRLEQTNKQLTEQNSHLTEQLEIAMDNLHRLETTRSLQQSNLHKLELQNRGFEVTVATLGAFIQQLVDNHKDIELPGDVRRIIAQLNAVEQRGQFNNSNRYFPLKVIEHKNNSANMYDIVKSNSTGRDTKLLLTKDLNTPYPLKSALSQPNLSNKLEKVSSFFANSHNHIKQQRAQRDAQIRQYQQQQQLLTKVETSQSAQLERYSGDNERNNENDSNNVNIDVHTTNPIIIAKSNPIKDKNHLKVESTTSLEKSVSLPLSNSKLKLKSSKSAWELGSIKKIPTTKLEDTVNDSLINLMGTMHPLDTCSDVNFKYGGTMKLKSIKPISSKSSSVSADHNSDTYTDSNYLVEICKKERNNLQTVQKK